MKKYAEKIKPLNFVFLVIAGIINSVGVTLFLSPSGVMDSGISGLSLFLSKVTPLMLSLYLLIFNLPLFIFGMKKQGWRFVVYSLTAIFSYSLASYVFQKPLGLMNGVFAQLNNDILLAAVFGGLISGIGSGLTIRFGGAIDGIEVLAVIFAKRVGVTVGQFIMFFNAILYIVACIVMKNLSMGLYSLISYFIGLYAVDFVVEGLDKSKACIIITRKGKELAAQLSKALGHGLTVLEGKGYYSNENKTMLYAVINRFEIGKVKNIISSIDPEAFVTVNDISEVIGSSIKMTLRKKKIVKKVSAIKPIDTDVVHNATVSSPKHHEIKESVAENKTEENKANIPLIETNEKTKNTSVENTKDTTASNDAKESKEN